MGTEPNSLTSVPPEEDKRSSSEIESDIRRTRDRLDDTLERLNERLNPRSLINDVLSWFESQDAHRTGNESSVWLRRGYRKVVRQIKEKPIPALLIGAGITWMIMHPESDDSSDFDTDNAYRGDDLETGPFRRGEAEPSSSEKKGMGSVMKEKAGQAKKALSGAQEAVAEKVSEVKSGVQATATSAGSEISKGVRRNRLVRRDATQRFQDGYAFAGDRFQEAVEEYPLGVALGFLGLGVLTGLLLPRTRQEDKLMGETSDELMEQAKEAGKETLEKTKNVAQRVAASTIEEAKRQGITPETAGHKVSEIADKFSKVATQAKEEAARAGEEEGLKQGSVAESSKQRGEETGR